MTVTAQEIAAWTAGRLEGDGSRAFDGLESLDAAGPGQMTFLGHAAYSKKFADARAGGALITEGLPVQKTDSQVLVWVPNADLAVAQVLEKLAPPLPYPPVGVHPSAAIDPSAAVSPTARVGPFVTVQANARVGANTVLMAGAFVGSDTVLGDDCVLWPHVTVRERCTVGHRVILHAGCVVGADGFGYRFDQGRHVKIPQIGTVVVGDDCEIGANTTIDRGKFSATVIGAGSKIDNQVQVGHNSQIGKHTILIAHVSVGGSVKTGDYAVVGGGSAIQDHITLGKGAKLAGFSVATQDIEPNGERIGAPALEPKEWMPSFRALRRLPQLKETVRQLEQRVAKLESEPENHQP